MQENLNKTIEIDINEFNKIQQSKELINIFLNYRNNIITLLTKHKEFLKDRGYKISYLARKLEDIDDDLKIIMNQFSKKYDRQVKL